MHYEGSIIVDDSDIREYDKKELNIIISHFSASRNEINPEAVVKEWILGGRINHKKSYPLIVIQTGKLHTSR